MIRWLPRVRRARSRSFAAAFALTVLGLGSTAIAQTPPQASLGEMKHAAPSGVPLEALLAYAETHSPALRVASKRTGYAAAARAGADPLLRQNPTLEFAIGPRFNGAVSRDFDFVAALSQPVEIAGERASRVNASEKLERRLESEVVATRWHVRRNVVYAFNAALVAKEQTQVATQVQRFCEEMLGVVQRRLAAGEATAIEVRVAELEVARSKHSVLVAEQSQQQARLRLSEAVGWPVAESLEVNGDFSTPSAPPALATLLSATERHPTLLAQRAAIDEAQARRELAEREGTLTPVVGVQVSREGAAGSPANYILLGTLGVPLPLWQRNQQQRVQTRVDAEVAVEEERASRQSTRSRVAQAHSEMSSAFARLTLFADEIAPRLDESLTLLRRGFEAGEIPLLDVAVARERFLTVRRDLLLAYVDYYRAAADLEFATGAELNTFKLTGGAR